MDTRGYFIYDFFDMLLNQKVSQSWELLFHHVVTSGLRMNLGLQRHFCECGSSILYITHVALFTLPPLLDCKTFPPPPLPYTYPQLLVTPPHMATNQ
ncbi:TLC domain-containing protein 2 [Takifugu flavidus]|uniref:TLC domain-containing protein 2 n=1 Tax=Takifugu flavidus TaxID=433684 RepID=A0A5C6PG29_9TELE|nr:TLC domain-containing protein 2 [Takifugu flavidus]